MSFPTPLSQEGRPMFWRESSNGISVAAFFSARALGTLVQRDGNGESFLPRKIYKNLVNNGITILTGTGFLSSTMAPEDECLCFLNNTTYVAICFFCSGKWRSSFGLVEQKTSLVIAFPCRVVSCRKYFRCAPFVQHLRFVPRLIQLCGFAFESVAGFWNLRMYADVPEDPHSGDRVW